VNTSLGRLPLLDDVVLTTSVGRMLLLAGVELGRFTVSDGVIEPDPEVVKVTVSEGDVEVCGAVVGTVSVGVGEDSEFDELISEGDVDPDGLLECDELLELEVAVSLGVGVTLELCGGGGYVANAD
jgi:hypothetical protein